MATTTPSKCSQGLDGIIAKLETLKNWDKWEGMPYEVIPVYNFGAGKMNDASNKNYTQRIELATNVAGGKFGLLVQALPNPDVREGASGPVLVYSYQIDINSRIIFGLDAIKALERAAKFLHEFTPVDNKSCRELKLKSITGGESLPDKTFYVHKLTFTWEAPL